MHENLTWCPRNPTILLNKSPHDVEEKKKQQKEEDDPTRSKSPLRSGGGQRARNGEVGRQRVELVLPKREPLKSNRSPFPVSFFLLCPPRKKNFPF